MRRSILALVLAVGLASPALAGPDFTAAVDAAAAKIKAAMADPELAKASREDRAKKSTDALNDAVKDISVADASVTDIATLIEKIPNFMSSSKGADLKARLAELAKDQGVDGAAAAELAFTATRNFKDAEAAAPGFISHPALGTLLASGKGTKGLAALRSFASVMSKNKTTLFALADSIPATGSPTAVADLTGFFMALVDATSPEDKGAREPLRLKVLALAKSAASTASSSDERTVKSLERSIKQLESTLARGELLGNTAPELNFAWASPDLKINGRVPTKLSDLKGKVVVVDFWATWCGPCVGSFPQVRELVERYEGYDVVVLGVTSIQGNSVVWADGRPKDRVDTKGNPDKEYELMGAFMQDMNMTWPVVFSEEAVFNPEYGVNGIPHVAIIDTQGKLRYRGLHPANPMPAKAEKIDGLLMEAGLKAPPAATTDAEHVDEKNDKTGK